MKPQTLLCFDYGTKRIGTAVGQTLTATATALKTIHTYQNKPNWKEIRCLIDEWSPDKLIVGHPLTLGGERQEMTSAAERFGRQLQGRFQIAVEMMAEQLSSFVARQELKSSYNVDPTAARLILESWLQEHCQMDRQQH